MGWCYCNDIFRFNSSKKKMKKIILITPLILLVTICLFFLLYILLEKNPNKPPSALLNKNLPVFVSKNLYDNNTINKDNLIGKITLINFFASWCNPCRAEHHLLFEIKKEIPEIFIVGFSHKDNPKDSKKYLEDEGNPYSFVGLDQDGKIAFEFGVFGLPETFVTNKNGQIIYKHTGPLTKKILEDEIKKLF